MRIISEDYDREEIEKKMEVFKNKLPSIKSDCGVVSDVGWQDEYIVNRKLVTLELISIIERVEYGFDDDPYTYTIEDKEKENLLRIVRELKNRLLELDSSIEEVYRELIQFHQWVEDQKELCE